MLWTCRSGLEAFEVVEALLSCNVSYAIQDFSFVGSLPNPQFSHRKTHDHHRAESRKAQQTLCRSCAGRRRGGGQFVILVYMTTTMMILLETLCQRLASRTCTLDGIWEIYSKIMYGDRDINLIRTYISST